MRDADVRSALLQQLQIVHRGEADTRIVQEMGVWAGTVRIDVAVINGELSGFELKSDRDTLERLPAQAALYSRVFDRVTLVTGARHAEKAEALIPNWWGIQAAVEVDGAVVLSGIRPALKNPSPDPFLVAELLWKAEAIEVLEGFDLARGWRSKAVNLIHRRLADELPFSVLSEHVRYMLKRRGAWSGQTVSH